MAAPETEEVVIEARFLEHDPHKSWRPGRLVRVVNPPFADSFVAVRDTRTGARRDRPFGAVQVQVIGPKGGRRWVAISDTELAGGPLPIDSRPSEEDEGAE